MTERLEIGDGLSVIPLLFGPQDSHRKMLERSLNVRIGWRSPYLSFDGDPGDERIALEVAERALKRIDDGGALFLTDLRRLIDAARSPKTTSLPSPKVDAKGFSLGRSRLEPKSKNQAHFLKEMNDKDLVFCSGPAGTGKTYLAMAFALRCLHARQVDRIILTRPAVEAGERLGFLPGSLVEKVNPYLRPLFDALYELVGPDETAKLMATDLLEIAPLAFMRGRTLGRAFVILDEAQNATIEQTRMFLTRIGQGAKVVVNGDPSQSDLPYNQRSGFPHAIDLLSRIDGIGFVKLDTIDVVRHPLVRSIIKAYESAGEGTSP